jgi:hypothetical protein
MSSINAISKPSKFKETCKKMWNSKPVRYTKMSAKILGVLYVTTPTFSQTTSVGANQVKVGQENVRPMDNERRLNTVNFVQYDGANASNVAGQSKSSATESTNAPLKSIQNATVEAKGEKTVGEASETSLAKGSENNPVAKAGLGTAAGVIITAILCFALPPVGLLIAGAWIGSLTGGVVGGIIGGLVGLVVGAAIEAAN